MLDTSCGTGLANTVPNLLTEVFVPVFPTILPGAKSIDQHIILLLAPPRVFNCNYQDTLMRMFTEVYVI